MQLSAPLEQAYLLANGRFSSSIICSSREQNRCSFGHPHRKKMSRVILFLALVLASVVAEDKFAEANAAKLRTVAAKEADLASKNTKAPDLFAAKNAEKLAAAAAKDASKNTKVEKPLTEADFKQKNAEKLAAAKTKTADAFAAKNAEKRAR